MEDEQIRKAIIALLQGLIPLVATWGVVKSIEGKTCTVTIDELDYSDVLLGFDKSGVVITPKKDSRVLVLFTDKGKTNGSVIIVEQTDGVEVMGNEFGGLVQVKKLTDKINALEEKVNSLINSYTEHTHPATLAVSGSSATGTTNTTVIVPAISTLTLTEQADIENIKVKHGKG